MKIHVFQSEQGDCLMVEDAAEAHRILCDGGTPTAMRRNIATELGTWREAGKAIDLAYISHIDSDHIGGIAVLLDLMMQWKVFDFHQEAGDPSSEPQLPRTPEIHRIWHNAFRDLITDNVGDIEELLAASAPMLQASQVPDLVHLGHEYAQIATSVKEALTVSRLIKPERLDIALNALEATPDHSGKLLMARPDQAAETIGGLTVSILCPTPKELRALRKGWGHWLRDKKNRQTAREVRDLYAGQLEASAGAHGLNPIDLHEWEGVAAYKNVTAPNVASTVLLVEEDEKTLLLTGDNHPDMILAGLKSGGHLGESGGIHLTVLKYPHHGSEHNVSSDFTRKVSADHYIFCGDGSNTNPEIEVLEEMLAARVDPAGKRAVAPEAAGRSFKFWFSTSPALQTPSAKRDHMKAVEKWAQRKAAQHAGVFSFEFSDTPCMTIAP